MLANPKSFGHSAGSIAITALTDRNLEPLRKPRELRKALASLQGQWLCMPWNIPHLRIQMIIPQ
jgi:hypothetical protein